MLPKPKYKQEYTRINADDIPGSSSETNDSPLMGYSENPDLGLMARLKPPKMSLFAFAQTLFNFGWTLLLMLVTVLYLLTEERSRPGVEWHDTDLEPVRSHIARIPMKFTSGLYWNETTGDTTYRTWNELEPVYVGQRTPELDAAWDDISLHLYITKDEAMGIPEIPQGMYQDPETGKYMVIVEAIHSLHCLNMLRKRIYIHDYPEMDTPTLPNHIADVHRDHCIEALRQNLMCTADMTPAPIFYSPAIDKVQPNFEIVHSCRNLQPLLDWARTRSVHQKYD